MLTDSHGMQDAAMIERIRTKYKSLVPVMDERSRRQWAAAEALELGWGGVSTVSKATGLSRNTISAGIGELRHRELHPDEVTSRRLRSEGAGRKRLVDLDTGLLQALERLVAPATRGHPESPLRWTCKSTRKLADELKQEKHIVSERTVARLLKQEGYSLQANRKTREGSDHPDRNAQFEHINKQVIATQRKGHPVISVDTKKKELIGEFKNGGQEWQPKRTPVPVNVHDFPDRHLGKAIPYGIYDLANNAGWVNVGITHATAEFAVASIRRWWREIGKDRFPGATELMITADGGGSNSSRNRLWKKSLQAFANQVGMTLKICHFPPGTSKWNKIEHRLFCFITKNWRGRPLTSYEVIVNLIASTTTKQGLTVQAALDTATYQIGIEVTDEELSQLNIVRAKFHGEWNYSIKPQR